MRSREGRCWEEEVLRRVPKVGLKPDDDMSGDEQGGVVSGLVYCFMIDTLTNCAHRTDKIFIFILVQ